MQHMIVLVLVSAISVISLPLHAEEISSLKQVPSLSELLEKQTKPQLIGELVMLYDYIDWQDVKLEESRTQVLNRDAALKDCGQSSCGFPVTEVVIGLLVGGLTVSLLD